MTIARRIAGLCSCAVIVAALLGALSCQDADSVVVVSVTAGAGLPAVDQLRVMMSNGMAPGTATSTKLYPQQPAAPLAFAPAPVTFSVVVPRSRSGAFDIAIDGLSAGAAVANGAAAVSLKPGGRVDVAVMLESGASSCGNHLPDPGEGCDDGNRFSGDGCDFLCQVEAGGQGAGGSAGSKGAGGVAGAGGEAGGGAAGLGATGGNNRGEGGNGGAGVSTGGSPGSGGLGAGGTAAAGSAGMGGVAANSGMGGARAAGGAAGGAGGAGDALEIWYRFDDGNGTSAADASGKARPGTLVSVSPGTAGFSTTAKVGSGAVDLMGQGTTGGGYVLIPGSLGALAPDAVTIACWVYLRTSPAEARVFDFGVDANTSLFLTPNHAGLLGLGGNAIEFQIAQGGRTQQSIQSSAALPTGAWHHVAVVLRSGATYTGALYVDGALAGMNTSMTLHPSDLGVTINNWLGRSTTSSSDPFLDGLLDDFRIYSRALADSEIAALYQGP